MAWARIDDGFHDHPKVDELSLSAIGLWTVCLTWAHRHRRTAKVPGHITEARVRKVAGQKGDSLAAELVRSGLWELVDGVDGWVIHDFADYEPKHRDAEEAAAAGRRGAAKRWQTDSSPIANSHDVAMQHDGSPIANGMANDGSRASARAFPSRPVPKDLKPTPPTTTLLGPPVKITKGTRVPESWRDSDAGNAWLAEHAPAVDAVRETAQWLDYHRAKGDTAKDWAASWRTWMRRAQTDSERRPANYTRPAGNRPSTTDAAVSQTLALAERLAQQEIA